MTCQQQRTHPLSRKTCKVCNHSSLKTKRRVSTTLIDHEPGCAHVVPRTAVSGAAASRNAKGASHKYRDLTQRTFRSNGGQMQSQLQVRSRLVSVQRKPPRIPSACHPVRRIPCCWRQRLRWAVSHIRHVYSQVGGMGVVGGGRERTYRSPRLRAELQSLSVVARSPRLVDPLLILLS